MRTTAAAVLAGLLIAGASARGEEPSEAPPLAPAAAAEEKATDSPIVATPSTAPPAATAATIELLPATPVGSVRESDAPPPAADAEAEADDDLDDAAAARTPESLFTYEIHGFVRGGYTLVDRDEESFSVGQNSGFRLYNTRLNFVGQYGNLVSFDLSVDHDSPLDPDTNGAPFSLALRDANAKIRFGSAFVRVGQFKSPFNGEFLLGDGDVPFARRSVLSEGLAGDEGRLAHPAMGLDRQIGASVGGRILLGESSALELELAGVNGNGRNQGRNDNRLPAVVGRAQLGVGGSLIGLSAYWNERTVGHFAARQDERDLAADLDFLLHFGRLSVFGMFAVTRTEFVDVKVSKPSLALGGVGSLSYTFDAGGLRFEPAVRGAWFAPSDLVASSDLIDVTGGLNIYPGNRPIRLQLNGTVRVERDTRSAPNNLFEAVVQANF